MSDPSPALQARLKVQQNVREQFIAIEEVKLLRDAVAECYRKEGLFKKKKYEYRVQARGLTLAGVNHYENCKEQVVAYMERTRGTFPSWGALKQN